MKKLLLVILITTTTTSYAEFYKCMDTNKNTHYQDHPCTHEKEKLATYKAPGQYTKRNPEDIQNEVRELEYEAELGSSRSYRYYRPESNELIDSQKRKEAENQVRWDSIGGRNKATQSGSQNNYEYDRSRNR
jgi:hypothetical protein